MRVGLVLAAVVTLLVGAVGFVRVVVFGFDRALAGDAPPPVQPAPPAQPPQPAPKPPTEPAPPVAPRAKGGAVPSWAKVAPEQIEAGKAAGVPVAFENSIGMRFVLIPAGTFTMGSPPTEAGRKDCETPHPVTLTKPYYVGITEVTNAQYQRFKKDHDSGDGFNGDDQPVVRVSWDDAVAFVAWLNAQDRDRTYLLPTEAEWERACRAGSTTAYSFGDEASKLGGYAWTEGNSGDTTHPVGALKPNAWGLYDMHGNVMEWCQDWYAEYPSGAVTDPTGASGPGPRVLRGGSWGLTARLARSADRGLAGPGLRMGNLGFRLAMTVTSK